MEKNQIKKKTFSILKTAGLLIAAGALVYKAVFTAVYFDSITDWWQSMIVLFFLSYLTSFAAIASAFLKGKAAVIAGFVMAGVSLAMLFLNAFTLLGFVVSLDYTPLIDRGIMPLVNLLNLISGILVAVGAIIQRRRQNA
ncbi:MAG: hypothetical protein IJJ34_07060 [Clostridia bacterium]|nr:hypothetical protein [Clostridia bacterium]